MTKRVVLPLRKMTVDLTILESAVRDYINSMDKGNYPPNESNWSMTKSEYYWEAINLLREITDYIKSPKITIEVEEK